MPSRTQRKARDLKSDDPMQVPEDYRFEVVDMSDTDLRRDSEVCTCDHDIWVHAAQAPQWCTVEGCRCPTLFTKAQAATLP